MRHLRTDRPVLAAVSGGRDSVALFHLLQKTGIPIAAICHLNHGWRGKKSDTDAIFVEELAKNANVRFISEKLGRSSAKRGSAEAVARMARWRFFAGVVRETGVTNVCLGHHADDQVETMLWNLLRGAGSDGLGAMGPEHALEVEGTAMVLCRPLLGFWREEINALVAEQGWKFREDATNRSPRFTRNVLRHEVIPWLEKKLGRSIREPLWRSAEILRAEDEWMEELTVLEEPVTQLEVDRLAAGPVGWQRRIIHAWLVAQKVPEPGFAQVESVRSLLDRVQGPARVNLPGNRQARRRAGKITMSWQNADLNQHNDTPKK